MSPRTRLVAAAVFGVVLVAALAAASVAALSAAECVGGADCRRDRDQHTAIAFAWPLGAAFVLAVGSIVSARARRARPLVAADGALVVLVWIWWHGWNVMLLWLLLVATAVASVTLWRATRSATPETPPPP